MKLMFVYFFKQIEQNNFLIDQQLKDALIKFITILSFEKYNTYYGLH